MTIPGSSFGGAGTLRGGRCVVDELVVVLEVVEVLEDVEVVELEALVDEVLCVTDSDVDDDAVVEVLLDVVDAVVPVPVNGMVYEPELVASCHVSFHAPVSGGEKVTPSVTWAPGWIVVPDASA